MQPNKKIKLISKFETRGANALFEGLDGTTTFGHIKQIANLLLNQGSNDIKYGLYYNNVEMNLNNDNATINEIFEYENDITIEIGPKGKQAERSNKISSYDEEDNKNYVFSNCDVHKNETAKYYCNICSESICFKCSLDTKHSGHTLQEKLVFYKSRFNGVNEKYEFIKHNIENNQLINNIKDIRSKHLAEIEEEFKQVENRLQELKNYYLGFFEEYYKVLEKNISNVLKQYGDNQKEITDLINNFSMREENFRMNIGKIESLGNTLNILMKDNLKLNDLYSLSKDLDFCCKENVNNLNYIIEKISLGGYFNDAVISEYEKISFEKSINKEIISAHEEIMNISEQIQDMILMPVPTSNKVLAYSFEKKKFLLNEIPSDSNSGEQFVFYDYSRYFNIGNWMIVTGGVTYTDQVSKQVDSSYIYDFQENEIHKIDSMKTPRSVHMLFFIEPKLIIAVSGRDNREIEIYNLQKRIWSKFKQLSKGRCNANVLNYEDKYLYIFGGSDSKSYAGNLFERIQISDLFNESLLDSYFQNNFANYKHNFESGNFIVDEKVNLLFTGFGVIELEDDNTKKFLVLGGYNSMFDNDYILNNEVRTAEFSSGQSNFVISNNEVKLPSNSCFYYQNFQQVEENSYALFNASGELITYDMSKGSFKVLKHKMVI